MIALVLVILVVYLFLQGWRATLIPLLAVPVSLVGTFVLFPLFGFSINTLSLFGLVLAIGLVVDDAIVVVEGRRTPHRGRTHAQGRGVEGDGGTLWSGRRNCAGLVRGIRARRRSFPVSLDASTSSLRLRSRFRFFSPRSTRLL